MGGDRARHHAVHQNRSGFLPGRANGTSQQVIGWRKNAFLLEPGATAGEESRGAVEPQRLTLEELVKPVCGCSIEGAQTQVATDALLMFGNGLAPFGVDVDRFRGELQLQGGEAQDLAVDLQRNLPGEAPEDADEGNLVGESQSVVGPSSLGNLVPVCFEEAAVADQTRAGDVGIGDRHGMSGENGRLGESMHKAKHNQFLILKV